MKFRNLLAKDTKDEEAPKFEETLLGHTSKVIDAIEVFGDFLTNDIINLLESRISGEEWRTLLFYCAWLHDLGKANDHFQTMIRSKGFRQGIRHETLSLIIIADLLDEWLQGFWNKYPQWIKAATIFAISGHHLKFPDNQNRPHSQVTFLGEHPQIKEILEIGGKHLNLSSCPSLSNIKYSLAVFGGVNDKIRKVQRRMDTDFEPWQKTLIACLKSTLICADIAGSALPKTGEDIKLWLQKRIHNSLDRDKVEEIANTKLKNSSLHDFQREAQVAKENTLMIEAGCGSGKTIAAYLWIANHAHEKRAFFCYPTTATASEGFGSYLPEPDFESILIHSRAKIDYELLESMPERGFSQKELRAQKLETFETWPIPLTVCTAHTVLGLLQNARRGIHTWPSIIRSVFVFDEIHSFSDKLFQHLLRFLEIFHSIPVLLMTATLPSDKKEALQEACQKRGAVRFLRGPEQREQAKRYLINSCEYEVAWEKAADTLKKKDKVLWICNTINRAMETLKQAKEKFANPIQLELYHSRFKYKDRLKKHEALMDLFKSEDAVFVVTTQVAEMSLDLSADLLVSEYAPIPSLIQRMGRLNRFEECPKEVKEALFVEPENTMPYEGEHLWDMVKNWLEIVSGTPQSQREVTEAFLQIYKSFSQQEFTAFSSCDWLDDPWTSLKNRHSIMEPGYTLEMIMEEDCDKENIQQFAIPMPFPKGKNYQAWNTISRYFIAPQGVIEYDAFLGGFYGEDQSIGYEIIGPGNDPSA